MFPSSVQKTHTYWKIEAQNLMNEPGFPIQFKVGTLCLNCIMELYTVLVKWVYMHVCICVYLICICFPLHECISMCLCALSQPWSPSSTSVTNKDIGRCQRQIWNKNSTRGVIAMASNQQPFIWKGSQCGRSFGSRHPWGPSMAKPHENNKTVSAWTNYLLNWRRI